MKLSIIFSVSHKSDIRFRNLKETLKSLEKQTFQDFETICIEQIFNNNNYYKDFDFDRYAHLRSPIMGDVRNRAWQKNFGVKLSRGELILFMDTDFVFDEKFLENIINYYDKTGKEVFVCWDKLWRLKPKPAEDYLSGKLSFDDIMNDNSLIYVGETHDYLYPLKTGPSEGAILFEKDFFLNTFGGWNESFFGWGYQDNEAAWRWDKLSGFDNCNNNIFHLPHGSVSKGGYWTYRNSIIYDKCIKNLDKIIENIQKTPNGCTEGPTIPDIPTLPKVYIYSFNVGSGIERFGSLLTRMLDEYIPIVYKAQNPPCILINDLARHRPDYIIINEYYDRILKTVYFYKMMEPKTKIIFLNHCSQRLMGFPKNINDPNICDHDGEVLLNYLFREHIDHIINLNVRNPDYEYPDFFNCPITEQIFAVEDKFDMIIPWEDRTNDFLYYGNIIPVKFKKEFIDKCKFDVDLYGKMKDSSPEDYNKAIHDNKYLKYHGFIPEEKLVEKINQYRFLIVPHGSHEPFNLVIAEAIRCGCILLLVNDTSKQDSYWINWAEGCYIHYENVDELLESMKYYLDNKNDPEFIKVLSKRAKENSDEMKKRTSFQNFKDLLIDILFND
jgi:hypothetical protein